MPLPYTCGAAGRTGQRLKVSFIEPCLVAVFLGFTQMGSLQRAAFGSKRYLNGVERLP